MGEHVPDIDLFPVVMNGSNQTIFVTSNIEHGKFPHQVGSGERDFQICKRSIISMPDYGVPLIQRALCIRMLLRKFDQPFPGDYMHQSIISHYEINVNRHNHLSRQGIIRDAAGGYEQSLIGGYLGEFDNKKG